MPIAARFHRSAVHEVDDDGPALLDARIVPVQPQKTVLAPGDDDFAQPVGPALDDLVLLLRQDVRRLAEGVVLHAHHRHELETGGHDVAQLADEGVAAVARDLQAHRDQAARDDPLTGDDLLVQRRVIDGADERQRQVGAAQLGALARGLRQARQDRAQIGHARNRLDGARRGARRARGARLGRGGGAGAGHETEDDADDCDRAHGAADDGDRACDTVGHGDSIAHGIPHSLSASEPTSATSATRARTALDDIATS